MWSIGTTLSHSEHGAGKVIRKEKITSTSWSHTDDYDFTIEFEGGVTVGSESSLKGAGWK